MKKKIIVVTGGAGFVGSHLIEKILNFKNFDVISLDNYSSGSINNHIRSKRVTYLKDDIKNFKKIFYKKRKFIKSVFHFGEFSRIYQSFIQFNKCFDTNFVGTKEVINFCLENNIKLIYSATSASLGNKGNDKNLSPYAFTKSKNLELLENLKKWFKMKFEIIYFYNVYGPRQIRKGSMATVIGIFEDQYINKKPLTIVKPGTQKRRFTHIYDTIDTCILAWKNNKNKHYSISAKKSFSIKQVARMFNAKIKFLPKRAGERYASALTRISQNNKIIRYNGKIELENYIKSFLKKN